MSENLDWDTLSHAYGGAGDVPDLIRALRDEDWEEACGELHGSILHQGSVYPATVAALPFLVEIGLDETAPGRTGALQLLEAYCAAIQAGSGRNPMYLPEGTDMERFDQDTRAGADDVMRALLPLAHDGDAEIRAQIYDNACYWEPAPELSAVLRERFTAETEAYPRVRLMEPLARHGLLTGVELQSMVDAGQDDAVFAAVWSALALGVELPSGLDLLVRLWPEQSPAYPNVHVDSLSVLTAEAGARVVPLLHRLRSQVEAGDRAEAWALIAEQSRAATPAALDALVELLAEPRDAATAQRVVNAVIRVQAEAGQKAPALADGCARLLPLAENDVTLRTTISGALFLLHDVRWAEPARSVVAVGERVTVAEGPGISRTYPSLLAGWPARRREVAWAQDDLIEVARSALAADPSAAGTWAELLGLLPPSTAAVDVLVGALRVDDLDVKAAVLRTLGAQAVADPQTFSPAAQVTLAAHPFLDHPGGAWLLTVQALLDRPVRASVFSQVWALGRDALGDRDLLRIWSAYPSPALESACAELLAGEAATSFPGRHRQLTGASLMIEIGRAPETWPTVRAIVDTAGEPMAAGARTAARVVEAEPALRGDWLDLLRDIAENGRETWSGLDPVASAVAAGHLFDLGELSGQETVERVLRVEARAVVQHESAAVTPVVADVLTRVLARHPSLREPVAQGLDVFLNGDERLPSHSDGLEWDVLLTRQLRAVLNG
ncbi:hypothetical protein [Kineosporia succinea]|uniref:HEAT repeat protein n=1 Tax=Kineosporia succinea TaxID=84632 RepID=A0ABT9P733_9ACTN|nr:hypothetical protein [Kineosporia succinea]MDP9828000.1 hypothetical protein [Kineosporia succinea]